MERKLINRFLIFLTSLIVLLSFIVMPTFAENEIGWLCRNTDTEISCGDGTCEIRPRDGFTPMEVTVRLGHMSVCAYSGCWNGTPILVEDDSLLYVQSHDLRWIHNEDAVPATFQLALNKDTRVAVLNGERFAHPMHCDP